MSFFISGIVGSVLFSLLLAGAIYHFYRCRRMGKTFISSFFASMIVYSALEIPRYVIMIVQRSHTSKVGYCLHVIAVGVYFVALSIICFSWMFLIYIEKQDKVDITIKKRSIYIANGVLFVFILLIYFCATAHSLEGYLHSTFYLVYMVVEVVLFLFYNSAVVFFGLKISLRFRNYIKTGGERAEAFRSALTKVLTLMAANTICAATRVTLLFLRILHSTGSLNAQGDSFAHYGLLWFTLTDLVPFCMGGATFLFVMGTGGRKEGGSGAGAGMADEESPGPTERLLGPSDSSRKVEGKDYHHTPHKHDTPLQVAKRPISVKTPRHTTSTIVDSDIDNTPETPIDDVITPPDEHGHHSRRARAHSYDANSSVTTNSPFYGHHDDTFSPHTPKQRWTSFNSSAMLPSSLSPPNASPHNRQFAKSLSNLRDYSASRRQVPSGNNYSKISVGGTDVDDGILHPAGRKLRIFSQRHAGTLVATGDREVMGDERRVVSSLSARDFTSEQR